MTITELKNNPNFVKLETDAEHFLRRKGETAITHTRSALVAIDKADDWEEVELAPALAQLEAEKRENEYSDEVAKLVRQEYSESEEFAIQRKAINAGLYPSDTSSDSIALQEYKQYNEFVEGCKIRVKEMLSKSAQKDVP